MRCNSPRKDFKPYDLGFDVGENVARDAVDLGAGLIGFVDELQEFADGVERKAEFARVADEGEPVGVGGRVAALAAVAARGWGHQAFVFVEADGLDFRRSPLGEHADR